MTTSLDQIELPHEPHEWVEIQAGQEGDLFWVGGLFSPGGEKKPVYDHVHIKICSSREEAVDLGKDIVKLVNTHRLIRNMPCICSFSEKFSEKTS